jgi:two-component sensor histidine kinase
VEEIWAMGNISALLGEALFPLEELERQGEIPNIDCIITCKDGSSNDYLVTVKSVSIKEGTILYVCRCITERKRAEEKIRASLVEKEILLKEVHHRVKNNMQIVSSLLELQSDSISDERSRVCLRESQNRIRSMALIHERLYQSKNFASIDLGEYIADLSQYLFNSYATESERVSLKIDAGDFALDIGRAVPCGLIINELISNSLKHAFPDGRSGDISVRVSSEGGWITLQVADTGVGMPAGLDTSNTDTLGLQLVNLLAKQLRGSISFSGGENGSVVIISFPGQSSP